jgi:hypothetical protein
MRNITVTTLITLGLAIPALAAATIPEEYQGVWAAAQDCKESARAIRPSRRGGRGQKGDRARGSTFGRAPPCEISGACEKYLPRTFPEWLALGVSALLRFRKPLSVSVDGGDLWP